MFSCQKYEDLLEGVGLSKLEGGEVSILSLLEGIGSVLVVSKHSGYRETDRDCKEPETMTGSAPSHSL